MKFHTRPTKLVFVSRTFINFIINNNLSLFKNQQIKDINDYWNFKKKVGLLLT